MKKILTIFSLILGILLVIGTVSAATATLRPVGNLAPQWTRSNANVLSYTLIDEATADSTDYVSTSGASKIDSYHFGDLPTDVDTINSITLYYNAAPTGWFFGWYLYKSFQPVISLLNKPSYYGSTITLNVVGSSLYSQTYTLNPTNGLKWTIADVDLLRAGMSSVTGGKINQFYISVDYVSKRCGDGIVSTGEDCDGANLNGMTCQQLIGYPLGGILKCSSSCKFDTSSCAVCGNGIIEGIELCDGANLGNQTCAGVGFEYGFLQCNDKCNGYNTNYCSSCGDGKVLLPYEECDGYSHSCTMFGYTGGIAPCNSDCTNNLDRCFTSQCSNNEIVGNETVSSPIIKGTVTGITYDNLLFSLDDYCDTETSVLDYHCDTSRQAGYFYSNINCLDLGYTGCLNGVCI